MFKPQYSITPQLLQKAKRISNLVIELNSINFSDVVLAKLASEAKSISTYASTSIEGNPLPLAEVKQVLKNKPQHLNRSEQEVLNYNQVLEWLERRITRRARPLPLRKKTILRIHQGVINNLLPKHQIGKWRQEPVVIKNTRTGQLVFLPPDHQEVEKLTTELVEFVAKSQGQLDPVILAGIFHKQFVLIHPFMDGNGRTTRLATQVLLSGLGLNTFKLFSFENYYNQDVGKYFRQVGERGDFYELKKPDFTSWLEYFAEGILDELQRVKKLLEIEQSALEFGPKFALKPYHRKVLNFIKKHGFIADRDYRRLVPRAKATRALDFRKLIEMGLIIRKGRGRATYYELA